MKSAEETRSCPAPDTIAALAEGRLNRHELAAVLAHVDGCPSCMEDLKDANAHVAEERSRRPWAIALAAVIAVAALAVPAIRFFTSKFRTPPAAERLITLSAGPVRPIEPRLSGEFAWAPFRGPERAEEGSVEARRLKLAGAAGELVEAADNDPEPRKQHDAGVALLLIDKPLDAVERLRGAATRANDAKSWNDLAAALYTAAFRHEQPSLYPEALAAADHALRIDPQFAAALFNRAMILERLGLGDQAREAWQLYLTVDAASPWAAEARERMAKLQGPTGSARFKRDQRRLEQAAKAGDLAATRALVIAYPQQSRTWSEFEYLSRWAEKQDAAELPISRTIGNALLAHSGEALLREAVRAIDEADAPTRAKLAEAQLLYKRGRIAYSKQRPTDAEADLRRAAELFAAGHSPMALVARYHAASARYDRNDVRGARAELEELLAIAGRHPQFIALGAQLHWQLATCLSAEDDWPAVLPHATAAEQAFARLGEVHHRAFVQTFIASALVFLGRLDDGWATRIRSFETLTTEAHGDRLAVSVGAAVRAEARAGRLDAARALVRVEESIARTAGNDTLLAYMLVRGAVLSAQIREDAAPAIAEARAVAARIADPAMHTAAVADTELADGVASLARDPRGARERLTHAIDFYRTAGKPLFIVEAYLFRARAAMRLGDETAALRDYEAGIDAIERHRIAFGGAASGSGVVDATTPLLAEALRLYLDRGNADRAFECTERLQAQATPRGASSIATLAEVRRRLAGTGTVLLQFAMLPEELVTFRITADEQSIARRPIARARLQALAARDDDSALRELHEVLIAPSSAVLAGARELIVVAPPELESIPFATLRDAASGRALVEQLPIALAANASSLYPRNATRPRAVLAMALPAGEASGTVPLAETANEISDLRPLYPQARSLSGAEATFAALVDHAAGADVIHIASHTARQPGAGDAALVFAGRRVAWNDIAATRLAAAVVSLAACDTLHRPRVPQNRALSLGGAFLAAGAGDVIGTLRPIADADARALFREVHRQLAEGATAAEAVQRAQLQAIRERNPSWRALALVTTRISIR